MILSASLKMSEPLISSKTARISSALVAFKLQSLESRSHCGNQLGLQQLLAALRSLFCGASLCACSVEPHEISPDGFGSFCLHGCPFWSRALQLLAAPASCLLHTSPRLYVGSFSIFLRLKIALSNKPRSSEGLLHPSCLQARPASEPIVQI